MTPSAADALVPLLYADLRRLARRQRWSVSAGATMQTTALVNEAYLKLRNSEAFVDDAHFLRTASIAMRQVLVNLARAATAAKRGALAPHVDLDAVDDLPEMAADDGRTLLEIEEALQRLAALAPRLAEVVECRFFGGLSEPQTASALGVTERTVRRDWTKARAWLQVELGGSAG
jgi:RNA polymerase sigma factor (TIGR02999 family)